MYLVCFYPITQNRDPRIEEITSAQSYLAVQKPVRTGSDGFGVCPYQSRGDTALCARLGEMYVGTIHEFCFHLLDDKSGYSPMGYSWVSTGKAHLLVYS